MALKIPRVVQVLWLSKQGQGPILEECYEFLYLVSIASEVGAMALHKSGDMKLLASHILILSDGFRQMELAIKLVQLILGKLVFLDEYVAELSVIVAAVTRQFAVLHHAVKFDALHLLSAMLS